MGRKKSRKAIDRKRKQRKKLNRRGSRASNPSRQLDFSYEGLERRVLLAQVSWDGGGGNNLWHNRFNWDGDAVPVNDDEVTISGTTETIIFNQVETLNLASLTSDTSLTIQAGAVTSQATTFAADSTLSVDGAGTRFESIGSASITAVDLSATDGGEILFNDLTSYANTTGTVENIASITADGANSVVGLPGVATITNGVGERDIISIEATDGGTINLLSLTRIYTQAGSGLQESHVNVAADGTGSTIVLQSLLEFWDANPTVKSTLTESNGGTITAGELYTAQNVDAITDSDLISDTRNLIFYSDVSIESQTPIPISTQLRVYTDAAITGNLNVDADLQWNEGSSMLVDPGSTLALGGDVAIGTTSLSMQVDGLLLLDADSSSADPQLVEVYQSDDGLAGFNNFFAAFNLRTIQLGDTTYAQLVDATDNRGDGNPEALYADSFTIPTGATLDVNGLNVYTIDGSIDGTVINGQVTVDDELPMVTSGGRIARCRNHITGCDCFVHGELF